MLIIRDLPGHVKIGYGWKKLGLRKSIGHFCLRSRKVWTQDRVGHQN